ncbi:MAG: DUF1573 domain-containing protein [Saprospiraceae bacterium]
MVTVLVLFLQISSAFQVGGLESVVQWVQGTSHDFGTMEKGITQSVDFEFKNTSKVPLVLETVRTTCGCTAADWDQEPVEPGATGKLRIEYDAFQAGAFKKKIRVFFVEQKKPEILWIEGTVE